MFYTLAPNTVASIGDGGFCELLTLNLVGRRFFKLGGL
jgi:hypothetical protein